MPGDHGEGHFPKTDWTRHSRLWGSPTLPPLSPATELAPDIVAKGSCGYGFGEHCTHIHTLDTSLAKGRQSCVSLPTWPKPVRLEMDTLRAALGKLSLKDLHHEEQLRHQGTCKPQP